MAWGKLYSETVAGGDVNEITTDVFTSSEFILALDHVFDNGANNTDGVVRVGKTTIDVDTNYTWRWIQHTVPTQAADSTDTDDDKLPLGWGGVDQFMVTHVANIAGQEKLFIAHTNQSPDGTGSGGKPHIKQAVGKWDNTSDALDIFELGTPSASKIANDSNLSVLGSETTPAGAVSSTIQDGAVFEETNTNKHYLLDNGTWTEI